MANFSINSGIDVKAIVSSLMEVEKLKLGKLDKTKSIYDYQLAGLNNFNGLLKNFSDTVDKLSTTLSNPIYKVSSSDESSLNAVINSNTVSTGIHTVNITQLAKAHQLSSSAFTSKNTDLNTSGKLTVQSGAQNFSLTVNATDSLEMIRDKINNDSNNTTVTASILATTAADNTTEYRIVLSAKETGVANQITITGVANDTLGINQEVTQAKDAILKFDGYNVTRSSNTISDLLDGVTFTINAENKTVSLMIDTDSDKQKDNFKSALTSMVNSYNSIMDTIDKNESTKYLRDGTYALLKVSLQNVIKDKLGSGTVQSLLDLGVKTAASQKMTNADGVEYVSSGKLTIDDTILSNALNSNYDAALQFFTKKTTGFISTIQNVYTHITEEGGNISVREKSIKQLESQLFEKMDKEEARLEAVQNSLTKQYSDLNTFIERYQKLSNMLEQQLASINYNSNKK